MQFVSLLMSRERLGYKVGIIATDETAEKLKEVLSKNIGTRENEYTIAQNLYRVLREFDEEDVDYIYSEAFCDGWDWLGGYEPSPKKLRGIICFGQRRSQDYRNTDGSFS